MHGLVILFPHRTAKQRDKYGTQDAKDAKQRPSKQIRNRGNCHKSHKRHRGSRKEYFLNFSFVVLVHFVAQLSPLVLPIPDFLLS